MSKRGKQWSKGANGRRNAVTGTERGEECLDKNSALQSVFPGERKENQSYVSVRTTSTGGKIPETL